MHLRMSKVRVHKLLIVCSLAVLLLPTARAQVPAAISGTVTDQAGAALRDVEVTIKKIGRAHV